MHPESEHRKDKREATFRDRKNILEIAFQNLEKAYNCIHSVFRSPISQIN